MGKKYYVDRCTSTTVLLSRDTDRLKKAENGLVWEIQAKSYSKDDGTQVIDLVDTYGLIELPDFSVDEFRDYMNRYKERLFPTMGLDLDDIEAYEKDMDSVTEYLASKISHLQPYTGYISLVRREGLIVFADTTTQPHTFLYIVHGLREYKDVYPGRDQWAVRPKVGDNEDGLLKPAVEWMLEPWKMTVVKPIGYSSALKETETKRIWSYGMMSLARVTRDKNVETDSAALEHGGDDSQGKKTEFGDSWMEDDSSDEESDASESGLELEEYSKTDDSMDEKTTDSTAVGDASSANEDFEDSFGMDSFEPDGVLFFELSEDTMNNLGPY